MDKLSQAIEYAQRGWRVFPLHGAKKGRCTCGKADCTDQGKHPRTAHGLKDATIDPAIVTGWWKRWPDANLGIATGSESGLVVLDVDPRHGGDASLSEMEQQYGKLPETPEVLTGGGGRHLYFEYPQNGSKLRNATSLGGFQGIDLRASGGYIVAPSSQHASGKDYSWELSSRPADVPLAPVPEWLLALMVKGHRSDGKARNQPGWVEKALRGVSEGERDTSCIRLAGHYKAIGLGYQETMDILIPWGQRCSPPFLERDVEKCVKSAYGYLEREAQNQAQALAHAKEVALKWLKLRDTTIIDVVLGTIIANRAKGDPLWLLVVGAPSTGKSEIIRGVFDCGGIHYLGGFTKSTFVSGFEKHQGLLKTLGSGKTLVVKDFGTLLSMRREDRAEVLQQLREIYDGHYKKEYGNGKVEEWQGSMGLVGCVTSEIERHHGVIGELGNRYVMYRCELEAQDREDMATMALDGEGSEEVMREEIVAAFKQALDKAPRADLVVRPKEIKSQLGSLADLVSRLRSPVSRDSYNKTVNYIPDIEGPSRLVKAFGKLGKGVSTVRGKLSMTDDEYEVVARVGMDTVPRRRLEIVSYLSDREWCRTKEIANALDMPQATATCELEDLMMIGVLRREPDLEEGEELQQTTPYKWLLIDEIRRLMESAMIQGFIRNVPSNI